jgi:hypothetical protein
MRRFRGFAALLAILAIPLGAAVAQTLPETEDPVELIGLSIAELYTRYGPPESVYAARGLETWQDDAVFVYGSTEYYLYWDRVWQVKVDAVKSIRVGNRRGVIPLVLGEGALELDTCTLYPLNGLSWPMMLRFNVNSAGLITGIYIYRTDL